MLRKRPLESLDVKVGENLGYTREILSILEM